LDNCLKVGDWIVIDEWNVGEVCRTHPSNSVIDVITGKDNNGAINVIVIRAEQHKITKITKEVADIMIGV
jgi:hypothetical protein